VFVLNGHQNERLFTDREALLVTCFSYFQLILNHFRRSFGVRFERPSNEHLFTHREGLLGTMLRNCGFKLNISRRSFGVRFEGTSKRTPPYKSRSPFGYHVIRFGVDFVPFQAFVRRSF
jgi:hypothetical protein